MKIFNVVPFFESTRSEEYRKFLDQPFHIGMVGFVDSESHENINPVFHDWMGKAMVGWIKFTHEKFRIEFYEGNTIYKIFNPNLRLQREYTFPFPRNINDFVCDCNRCDINLQWSDFIFKEVDIKHIVSNKDYRGYIQELLKEIGKD